MSRAFLLALLLLLPLAARAQPIPLGPIFNGGTINLATPGGVSGSYDSQISVSGGGTQANNGLLAYTAAAQTFNTYDGSPQFRIGSVPSAVENWSVEGGLAGFGGTFFTGNIAGTGNVDGNFVTQGLGTFYFGSGAGTGFTIKPPASAATNWLSVTPGTTTKNPVLSSPTILQIDASVGANASAAGVSISFAGNQQVLIAPSGSTAPTAPEYLKIGNVATSDQFVHLTCAGSTNAGCYTATSGAGSFIYANGTGRLATLANSTNATTGDSLMIRTASSNTAHPITMAGFAGTSVAVGSGLLATTATAGFLVIRYGFGSPTGAPTIVSTDGLSQYFDATNLKLCIYTGGAWKCSGAFS